MSVLVEYLNQDKWRNWEAMLDKLPGKKWHNVLDLGSGPGLVSARLADKYKSVTAIDGNSEFLEAAKSHCPENCKFIEGNLTALNTLNLPLANGIWSSFTAAYFPDFAPVLQQWLSHLTPDGWVALVEIDGLFGGHHPLPKSIRDEIREYEDHMRSSGKYDTHMGRKLPEICKKSGLKIIAEYSWNDKELTFNGIASFEALVSWEQRFERMPGMLDYFGYEKYHHIAQEFLRVISSPEHKSTAKVSMVIARRN